jgi:tetratricopeptide (TPR) repeat protein
MHRIYQVSTTANVPDIAKEVYDIYDISGAESSDRLGSVVSLLRKANASLPSDDVTTVTSGTWIEIPKHREVRFRIPAEPASVRNALAAFTPPIRNIDQANLLTWNDLNTRGIGEADAERILTLCALMGVPGVGPSVAVQLYDSPLAIRSREELRNAVVGELRNQLNNSSVGPSGWRDKLPWSYIQHAAHIIAPKPPPVRHGYIPLPASKLEASHSVWQDRAKNPPPNTSVAEQESARLIGHVRRIQATLAAAHDALARRKPDAVGLYAEAIALTANAAKSVGVELGDAEEAGPSIDSVLLFVQKALDLVDEDHLEECRKEMGLRGSSPRRALRHFSLNDLKGDTKRPVVFTASILTTIADGGPAYERAWKQALADEPQSTFTSGMTGVTAPSATPVRSFSADSTARFNENLPAESANSLRTQFGDADTASGRVLSLHRLRESFKASSEDPADWTLDKALKSRARDRFPSTSSDSGFFSNMTAFDRYAAFRPGVFGNPSSKVFLLPVVLDDSTTPSVNVFGDQYKSKVLDELALSRNGDVRNLQVDDVADVASFLLHFPLMYATSLPIAMGQAMAFAGNVAGSKAMMQSAYAKNELATLQGLGFYERGLWGGVTGKDIIGDSDEELLTLLNIYNNRGDQRYKSHDYEGARQKYSEVIEICQQRPELQDLLALGTLDPDIDYADAIIVDDGTTPTEYRPFFHGTNVIARQQQYTAATAAWSESLDVISHNMEVKPLVNDYGLKMGSVELEGVLGGSDNGEGTRGLLDEVTIWDWEYLGIIPPGVYVPGHPKCPGYEQTFQIDVDAVYAAYLYAVARRDQVDAGLNWLGFDPRMVPVWSFDYLTQQSRYFCSKADELQQRGLSLAITERSLQLEEFRAEQAIALADKSVAVASARLSLANAQVTEAEAQKEVVDKRFDLQKAGATVGLAVAGALVATVAGVGTAGGATPFVVAGVGAAATTAGGSWMESKKHKREKAVAAASLAVAEAQVSVARAEKALASLQYDQAVALSAAMMGSDVNSETITMLLAFVETTASGYLDMANRLAWLAERAYAWEQRKDSARIYMSYREDDSLESRFAMGALLLQHLDSLEFERTAGAAGRIQQLQHTISLFRDFPSALGTLRTGGAATFGMSQQQLDLAYPGLMLHKLRRVEVEFDGILPSEGVRATLTAIGLGLVRVPNSDVHTQDTPDEILEFDWLYTDSEYTLEEAPFIMKPLQAPSATQSLSSYSRRNDSVLLAPQPGALDAFEHLVPTANWVLQLPSTANGFELGAISDVRVSLFFEALHDPVLETRQREILTQSPMSTEQAALFVASQSDSVGLELLQAGPLEGRADHRSFLFEVRGGDLLSRLESRTLTNINLIAAGLEAQTAQLQVRIAHTHFPTGRTVSTATGTHPGPQHGEPTWGEVYSGIGVDAVVAHDDTNYIGTADGFDGDPQELETLRSDREPDFPELSDSSTGLVPVIAATSGVESAIGTWMVKVLSVKRGIVDLKAVDDDGDIITVETGRLDLVDGDTATFTGTPRYARVTCHISGTLGTFKVSFNQVDAEVKFDGANLVGQVTYNSGSESASHSMSGESPDATYRIDVVVSRRLASIYIDGLLLVAKEHTYVYEDDLVLSFSDLAGESETLSVYDVEMQRLRHDGTPLEIVLSDSLDDASNWSLSGATHEAHSYSPMDLSFLRDLLLQVDYEGTVRSDALA